METEELTEEALAELLASYKKELAHLYRVASAKRALLVARKAPAQVVAECDADMRRDIAALKQKYGIHY